MAFLRCTKPGFLSRDVRSFVLQTIKGQNHTSRHSLHTLLIHMKYFAIGCQDWPQGMLWMVCQLWRRRQLCTSHKSQCYSFCSAPSLSNLTFSAVTAPKRSSDLDAEDEWAKASDTVDDVLGDFFWADLRMLWILHIFYIFILDLEVLSRSLLWLHFDETSFTINNMNTSLHTLSTRLTQIGLETKEVSKSYS